MKQSFNHRRGLIIVAVEIPGPSGTGLFRVALDTGASATTINTGLLTAIGYDPSLAPQRVQVTTVSGIEYAARVVVSQLNALGQRRTNFPVLAHTLPPSSGIDGLLGLDFLRGQIVNIDFRNGSITLS